MEYRQGHRPCKSDRPTIAPEGRWNTDRGIAPEKPKNSQSIPSPLRGFCSLCFHRGCTPACIPSPLRGFFRSLIRTFGFAEGTFASI